MANHKSAIKKYKRDEKKRLINKMNKTKMRNKIKKFKKEIETGKIEEAKTCFRKLYQLLINQIQRELFIKKLLQDINPD